LYIDTRRKINIEDEMAAGDPPRKRIWQLCRRGGQALAGCIFSVVWSCILRVDGYF